MYAQQKQSVIVNRKIILYKLKHQHNLIDAQSWQLLLSVAVDEFLTLILAAI
jgi:hypothetical protein